MEQKDLIIEKAAELFFKYGLRSVAIDDICKELHISKKTFYVHFHQKDELIDSLLERMREKRASSLEIRDDENLIDRYLQDVSFFKRMHEKKYVNFFYDLEKYYPELFAKHNALVDEMGVAYTLRSIRKGVADGYFREDIDLEMMGKFLYNKSNAHFTFMSNDCKATMGQIADFMIDCFIRLVVNDKGLAYYLSKKQGK